MGFAAIRVHRLERELLQLRMSPEKVQEILQHAALLSLEPSCAATAEFAPLLQEDGG